MAEVTAAPKFGKYVLSKRSIEAFRQNNGAAARAERSSSSCLRPNSPVSTEERIIGTPVVIAALPSEVEKLRVAYYARVSTLLDNQQLSIESQQEHFEELIKSDPSMVFAGSYVDAGISGTKAETRPELQRLLNDCRDGKIQVVMTKSISRFSRNTKDLLELVRLLKSYNVAVWFDKENIRTDSMESEFMLSLLAGFAEDGSRSISGNMKWAIRSRFKDGTYKQAICPYGYERSGDQLVISPGEAEVIRRIFNMALSGLGMVNIAKTLNEEEIPGPTGGK